MNKAHVFQHNTTGVQIFIYHCTNKIAAREEFMNVVIDYREWMYLGKKIAHDTI